VQPKIILCKIHWFVATITGSVCILCTVPGAPDISKIIVGSIIEMLEVEAGHSKEVY